MSSSDDLWPPDIAHERFTPPVAILRRQASLLAEKTRNLLEGEVSTSTRSDLIAHNFSIVAPALDDYRYHLFRISHPVTLYPISVEAGPLEGDTNEFSPKILASQEAFLNWLRAVFSSPHTKRVVSALLSQVED